MPLKPKPFVKPLPAELISRLKKAYARELQRKPKGKGALRALGRMKNIDHRKDWIARRIFQLRTKINPRETKNWGGRVREMNVSGNYSGTKLVLKRVHVSTAEKVIASVKKRVEKHNQKHPNEKYLVLMPDVHAIGKKIIAMQKIEGVDVLHSAFGRNPKRKKFINLLHENRISFMDYAVQKAKACRRLEMRPEELMLVGLQEGKLVFMPLLDLL
ncbi:MAG: hypothetical protein ABH986_01870 [archaeon]